MEGIMQEYRFSKYKIKLVKESGKVYPEYKITQPSDLNALCFEVFKLHEQTEEHFCLVTLDGAHKINGAFTCSIGLLNSSQVHPREVYKRALLNNSAAVIFIHNHPSGVLQPSEADCKVTKTLIEAGEILGIKVLDHLICGPEKNSVSMRDMGSLIFS